MNVSPLVSCPTVLSGTVISSTLTFKEIYIRLIYNVVLVSGVQRNDLIYAHTHTHTHTQRNHCWGRWCILSTQVPWAWGRPCLSLLQEWLSKTCRGGLRTCTHSVNTEKTLQSARFNIFTLQTRSWVIPGPVRGEPGPGVPNPPFLSATSSHNPNTLRGFSL